MNTDSSEPAMIGEGLKSTRIPPGENRLPLTPRKHSECQSGLIILEKVDENVFIKLFLRNNINLLTTYLLYLYLN